MEDQPRRMRYRQNFEAASKEKKPGFLEKLFGKKPQPEVKPSPHIDNSTEERLARNKLKEAATQMAMEHLKEFKEKNQRYPGKEEMDSIAQQIYSQFERSVAMEKAGREEPSKEGGFGIPAQGKSVAEERRARRGRGRGAGKAEEKKTVQSAGNESVASGKAGSPAEMRRRKRLERKGKKEMDGGEETPVMGEQAVEMPKEEAKNLSVQDLFGTDKQAGESDDKLSLEGLEDIDELKDLDKELSEIHDDLHLTKEIETSKNKCPGCGTKTNELVFCPSCGNAFCNHCAKKVDVQKEFVGYTCPKCSNSFKLKK